MTTQTRVVLNMAEATNYAQKLDGSAAIYEHLTFSLPAGLKNVVFVDWTHVSNFDDTPLLIQIEEFPTCGVTASGVPYWRSLPKGGITNNSSSPLGVQLYSPKDYKQLTVSVLYWKQWLAENATPMAGWRPFSSDYTLPPSIELVFYIQ